MIFDIQLAFDHCNLTNIYVASIWNLVMAVYSIKKTNVNNDVVFGIGLIELQSESSSAEADALDEINDRNRYFGVRKGRNHL